MVWILGLGSGSFHHILSELCAKRLQGEGRYKYLKLRSTTDLNKRQRAGWNSPEACGFGVRLVYKLVVVRA